MTARGLVISAALLACACGGSDSSPADSTSDGLDIATADDEGGITPEELSRDMDGNTPETPCPGQACDIDPEQWAGTYGQGCEEIPTGSFRVALQEGTWFAGGQVDDRPNTALVMVRKQSAGPCSLLQRTAPFCDPKCEAGQQCAPDGTCRPFPKPLDAGTVTISGLTEPAAMKPKGQGTYFKVDFAGPAFEEGSPIELTASGAETVPFSLQGAGVAPLSIPEGTWPLAMGKPLLLTWEPSAGPGEVQVELNLQQHAYNSHDLVCVLEDSGQFEVPQELTDVLIGYGVAGAPKLIVFRRTVDSVQVAQGCVEFTVAAYGKAFATLEQVQ